MQRQAECTHKDSGVGLTAIGRASTVTVAARGRGDLSFHAAGPRPVPFLLQAAHGSRTAQAARRGLSVLEHSARAHGSRPPAVGSL